MKPSERENVGGPVHKEDGAENVSRNCTLFMSPSFIPRTPVRLPPPELNASLFHRVSSPRAGKNETASEKKQKKQETHLCPDVLETRWRDETETN